MDYRKIAKGVTVEHWSDKDIGPDGIPDSRYWKQSGAIRQAFPYNAYKVIILQPWKWKVTLMLRMPDKSIIKTEIELKSGIALKAIDSELKRYRDEMLTDNPNYEAIGWRAVIIDKP